MPRGGDKWPPREGEDPKGELVPSSSNLVKQREARAARLVDSTHDSATSCRESCQLVADGLSHE